MAESEFTNVRGTVKFFNTAKGYTSILLNFAIHGSVPGIQPVQMPGAAALPRQ